MGKNKMNIAVSGAGGFVGAELSRSFQEQGHHVLALERTLFSPERTDALDEKLSQADIIVNLAGATINHRWSDSYKKLLIDSRLTVTRALVNSIKRLPRRPSLFISTSAVGYYPAGGCHDENSPAKGEDFLAGLCERWEHEARQVPEDVRLVIARFGIVLDKEGGAFEKIMASRKWGFLPFFLPGTQPFSWIDRKDMARAMLFAMNTSSLEGVVNFTAPVPLPHRDFISDLCRWSGATHALPIPAWALKLVLGEAAEVLTSGQCVHPRKLLDAGFTFLSPDIPAFLARLDRDSQQTPPQISP